MAKKTVEIEVDTYIATAPFEHAGKRYEIGDEFIAPPTWTRDSAYEEMVNQKKSTNRICFSSPEIEADEKTRQPYVPGRRILLPLTNATPEAV